MASNGEAIDYVKQYVNEERPGFALWVDGKWGTGKTWLIKKTLKEAKTPHIYISLYGLTNTEQIDTEIYRQLHPLLSSKPAKLVGLFIKALANVTVKLDLNNDNKEDTSFSASLPNFDKIDEKSLQNKTLVFDDIERSEISIGRLLGYINHFVEHDGNRTIVIGNTAEIAPADQDRLFARTKEKLVGHTISVAPDTESAINFFADELKIESAQRAIHANRKTIEELVRLSDADNLRNLRHGLKLFERLLGSLPIEIQQHQQIPGDLLRMTLALIFEVRSGLLNIDNINAIDMLNWSRAVRSTKKEKAEEKSEIELFYEKYRSEIPNNLILQPETWRRVLRSGVVPKAQLKRDLENSHYFPKQPDPWLRLWNFMSLEDSDFRNALAYAETRLQSESIENIEELIHTFHPFLQFPEELELSGISKQDALLHTTRTIGNIPFSQLLAQAADIEALVAGRGIHGKGFGREHSPEFVAVIRALEAALKAAVEANRATETSELLKTLSIDHWEFLKSMYLGKHSGAKYWNTPILKHMDAHGFVATVLSLPPEVRWSVNSVFVERYENAHAASALTAEADWLKSVAAELDKEFEKRRRENSSFFIGAFKKNLARIAEELSALAQPLASTADMEPDDSDLSD